MEQARLNVEERNVHHQMNLEDKVWATDPKNGFTLGVLKDIGVNAATVLVNGKKEKFDYGNVYPSEKDLNRSVDDNCALMYLNVANLLNNCRNRYLKETIYTYVANILVAINPYKMKPELYNSATIQKYKGKSLGTLPPHCYAIADKAYRDMKVFSQSQSMVVSGESGAGKTENTKFIIKYLVETYGSGQTTLDAKIIEVNPLLEAFGNAKTERNNNSSRFGKFIELHFNKQHKVNGAQFSHYLLERSRIVRQSPRERNYHIFYRLCAGAPDDIRKSLGLTKPADYTYLRGGEKDYFGQGLTDAQLNDKTDFVRTENAMKKIGLAKDKRLDVYAIVAGVLHIGNIEIEDAGNAAISDKGMIAVRQVAKILSLTEADLIESITTRAMKIPGQANPVKKALTKQQACHARDALAKALYSRLFDYICLTINSSLDAGGEQYIGILDIAGFEYFEENSFEQFCINYCNEKLQQFFNARTLKDEMELYAKEGLNVKTVDYVDNQDMIELIETPKTGILDILDEEMKLPKPLDSHFAEQLHQKHQKNFRFQQPRTSKIQKYRAKRNEEAFILRHFAGAVCYTADGFVDKNTDSLHDALVTLCLNSKHKLLPALFAADAKNLGKGKLQAKSNGSTFRSNLNKLMEKLNSTGSSFIRCIKPNEEMKPGQFDGAAILSQLESAGIPSVLELMQAGYPSRTQFSDLYNMYKKQMPPKMAKLDARLFCRGLFRALGVDETDYTYGVTKVFFKPGKFAAFDQMMQADPAHLKELIRKVEKWLICAKWRWAQYGVLMAIKLDKKIKWKREQYVTIQAYWRGYLARKRTKAKMKSFRRVYAAQCRSAELLGAAEKIPKGKARDDMVKQVKTYQLGLKALVGKIRKETIKPAELDAINGQENKLMESIMKLNKAEQERIRKIEEERKRREEEEKRRLQEEEQRRQQEEEDRRKRAEMEKQRKLEEAKMLKEKEARDKMEKEMEAARLAQTAEEEQQRRRDEQERRDREIAARLQMEQVEEDTAPVQPKNIVKNMKGQRYDLTKWTYTQLRDFINTSTDIDMIQACRDEFARRLTAYHNWRSKNKASNQGMPHDNQRMPESVVAVAEQATQQKSVPGTGAAASSSGGATQVQRYFRVPFKPHGNASGVSNQKLGWWYAHFDGQYVKRQMELHPNKDPILLIRGSKANFKVLKASIGLGKHDLRMCELSLTQTGLTSRKGAEIFPNAFDEVWLKCGGAQLTSAK